MAELMRCSVNRKLPWGKCGRPCLLLVYCGDYKCARSVVVHARWGDDVRLSDLEIHLSV
jgi:hypothetical protein